VAAYSRRDLLLGQAVSISQPQAMEGMAEGWTSKGALRVRSDGVHRVVSGEVSVRLVPRRRAPDAARLVAALVLANLLFFVWVRGWLAPGFPPPRQAESRTRTPGPAGAARGVAVLPAKAASAALNAVREAAVSCLEAGPYEADKVEAAEAALAAAQPASGAWAREPMAAPPAEWLVFAGRYADAAARRARQQELGKLGWSWRL
jgi:hypothetical protein